MPSPTCTVNGSSSTNGVDVADDLGTVTIQLVDLAADTWSLAVIGTDDQVVAPTLSINYTTKTATFTKPAGPWALIFRSQVNSGQDIDGQSDSTLTTTFGIYCDAAGGRLMASNERSEGSTLFGWITKINALIRAASGVVAALFGPSADPVISYASDLATTGATPTAFATGGLPYTLPDKTACDVVVTIVGKKAASADLFCADYRGRYYRNGGSATLSASVIAGSNQVATGSLSTATATILLSGNTIAPQVTGVAATNISWKATMQVQPVVTPT